MSGWGCFSGCGGGWGCVSGCNRPLPSAEVVEHACSVTSLSLGDTLSSVSADLDTYSYRVPLGVCAGVTP